MKHRRLFLLLVLLLVVGGLFMVPKVRWPIYGWVRGEAFYQGMPTSYWAKEIGSLEDLVYSRWLGLTVVFSQKRPRETWVGYVRRMLENDGATLPTDFPGDDLVHGPDFNPRNPEAITLLKALTKDRSAFVRWFAVRCLWQQQTSSDHELLLLYSELLHDPDIDVRLTAALASISLANEVTDATVPALTEGLYHEDGFARGLVRHWLIELKPDAKRMVPALVEAWKKDPSDVTIGNTLREIDPKAAAKAGIK